VSQLLQSSTIWLLLFQTILEDLWVQGLQETNYTSLWSMTWSRHVPNLVIGLSCIAFQTILNVASSHLRWVISLLSPLALDVALLMHQFLYLQNSLWFSQISRIDKYKLKDVELTNAIEHWVFISILLCSCINCKWGAEFCAACQHRSCRARAMMCNTCCSLQEVANVECKVCSVEHKVKIKCRASKMQIKLSENWKDEWSAKFGSIAWSACTGRMEGNKCSITWSCMDKIHSGSFIIRKSM
jgi:hypothetical protein